MRRPPDLSLAPFTLRQSRGKAALLLVGALCFSALGVWMLTDPTVPRWKGGLVLVFFGLCAAIFVAMLVRPGELTISSEGLTQRSLFRTHGWDWREVSNFRVWRMRRTQLVTFDDASTTPGRLRAVNAALGAGSATLVGSWELAAADLAALLNEARSRWGAR